MICPNCGSETTKKKCPSCGFLNTSILNADTNTQNESTPESHSKKSHMNTIANIFFALVLISIVTAIVIGPARREKKQQTIFDEVGVIAYHSLISFLGVQRRVEAMIDKKEVHYWANGETNFRDDFEWKPRCYGYCFYYFSNSDIAENATKYIFLAYPEMQNLGKPAMIDDEGSDSLEFTPNKEELKNILEQFGKKGGNINWEGSWDEEKGYTRLKNAEKWTKPNEPISGEVPK